MNSRISFRFLFIFISYIAALFVVNYFAFPHQGVGFFPYLAREAKVSAPVIFYFLAFSLPGFIFYRATLYRFSKPKPIYDKVDSRKDPFGVEVKLFHAPLEMPVEYSLWKRKLPLDFDSLIPTLQELKLGFSFDAASLTNEKTAITPIERAIFATLQAYPNYPADLSGYHDQSLLQHTFHVWAYARHKYPADQSEKLSQEFTKHQFIHILAAAHDLGKLMSYQPSGDVFTLVSTRHAMLSAVVLRQLPEYAQLSQEARRIINTALPLIDKNEHAKPITDNPSITLIARGCLHADAYITQREVDLKASKSKQQKAAKTLETTPQQATTNQSANDGTAQEQTDPQEANHTPSTQPVVTQSPAESTVSVSATTTETSPAAENPTTSPQEPHTEKPAPQPTTTQATSTAVDDDDSSASIGFGQDVYSLGEMISDCLPSIFPKLNINKSLSASEPLHGIYRKEYGCVFIFQATLIKQLAQKLPPEIVSKYQLDFDQNATNHPASVTIATALRETEWINFTVNNVTTDTGVFLVRSGRNAKLTACFAFFDSRIPKEILQNIQPWEYELTIRPQVHVKN